MQYTRNFCAGLIGVVAAVFCTVDVSHAIQITKTWDVGTAERDLTWGRSRGGHAFYLSGLPGSNRYVFDGAGLFTAYDDGTASLTGTILRHDSDDKRFAVDLLFSSHTGGWGGPKKELRRNAYRDGPGGGGIDTDDWAYYDLIDGAARLIGLDYFEGVVLELLTAPANGKFVFQLGVGANGKNLELGLSGWFGHSALVDEDLYDGRQVRRSSKGDINIDLAAYRIPEPPGAALLLIGLVALLAFSRPRPW